MLSRKMHMIVTAVVLLAACAWLPFSILNKDVNVWLRVASGLVGVLAFVILFERDMYLPFLADCAFPSSLLVVNESRVKGDNEIAVSIGDLPAGVKVVYWASEPKDPRSIQLKSWKEAYGDYTNAGVVITNNAGVATLTVRCPQAYTVSHFGMHKSEIPPHIHYRYELPGTKGMLSEVFTLPVKCDKSVIRAQ